jgi:hypothetical protein
MLEPDVTLTDFLVTIECLVCILVLWRAGSTQRFLRFWFSCFFAAAGLAALLGGIRHGFVADRTGATNHTLEVATMVALGLATLAAWIFGTALLFSQRVTRFVTAVAILEFLAYCVCAIGFSQSFLVVIVNYLPSALYSLVAFILVALRHRVRAPRLGIAGVLLLFVGAGLQQARVSVHPEYFTYNSVYHVVQMVSLLLILLATRWIVSHADFRPVLARAA